VATVTLRLTPQRAHVRTARLVAAAMARRSGVAEDLLDEIRLAVGEACGRAVQLHERGGIQEPVVLTLIDDDRFEVIVRDLAQPAGDAAGWAGPEDPASSHHQGTSRTGSARAWEEPLDTGLGLALLDALVEDMTVDAAGTTPGTQVRMSWPIDRPVAEGGPDRVASSPVG
jgi:anti-sigma regulatory factor (Ser/Thr protein kinase)